MPDELKIIKSIVRKAGGLPKGYAEIGDDVAVVPHRSGKLMFKADMLVEHTDVPPGMTYRQAARKAVAMCVSDFAAKGVRPDSFMVSLGLKAGVTKREVEELASGLKDAERRWGVHLVGGDTNESKELVIDCTMVGFAEKIVGRKGASPGDRLVVTGPFGLPPAGLKVMLTGANASLGFSRRARRSVLEPDPDLELGLALGPYLTSAMDSSDGLARSVHTLAKESGVGFQVEKLPVANGILEFAKLNGLDMERLIFEGGEEYVIVGTVKESRMIPAEEAARRAGGRLLVIGRANASRGRVVLLTGGKVRPLRNVGWTHLS